MAPDLVQLPDHRAEQVGDLAQRLGAASIVRAIETLGAMLVDLRHAPDPRVLLEVALVKLTSAKADPSGAALAARIEKLEHALARAGAAAGGAGGGEGGGPPGVPGHAGEPGAGRGGAGGGGGRSGTTDPSEAMSRSAASGPAAGAPSAPATGSGGASATMSGGAPAGSSGRAVLGARARRQDSPADPRPPAGSPGPDAPPTRSVAASAPASPTDGNDVPDAGDGGDRSVADRSPTAPPRGESPAGDESRQTTGASPRAGTAGSPSRDQLTLAWADEILVKLRPIVRAVYGAGRFVDAADGGIAFAVPNEPHRRRCEENRADVEKVISEHFGVPVRLVLVVDGGSHGGPATTSSARPAPPPDEEIDPSELVDAPKGTAMSPVDRIAAAFPGSELVDEED
jgi:DNA polymerase-3 subunit gamma/tau